MTQKGIHTWDLILEYHRCPSCGYIVESRQGFVRDAQGWSKNVPCERCGTLFAVHKPHKSLFGPLTGDPQPIEIDWNS